MHDPVIRGGATGRRPNFGGTSICLHPLTQNDEIRRGNIYRDGRVLGSQSGHCILDKRVARFVSDRWISC